MTIKSAKGSIAFKPYYYYQKVELEFYSALDTGEYSLTFRKGLDMNTLITDCDYEVEAYHDSMKIKVKGSVGSIMLPSRNKDYSYKKYVEAECQSTKLEVEFSDSILCSSIDTSDFRLQIKPFNVPNYLSVNKIEPLNCKNGLTNRIVIYYSDTIPEGNSHLSMINGRDGNTVLNRCAYPVAIQGIQVYRPEYEVGLGPDHFVCEGEKVDVVLNCGGGHDYVLWSNGESGRLSRFTEVGKHFVTIGNKYGCRASDTVEIAFKKCYVGIENVNHSAEISVYPNPNNGVVFVDLKHETDNVLLQIKNITGRIVSRVNLTEKKNRIELNGPAGLYFFELLSSDGANEVYRVVKH